MLVCLGDTSDLQGLQHLVNVLVWLELCIQDCDDRNEKAHEEANVDNQKDDQE